MRIPILTYHSLDIHGNRYEDNDLVAIANDLQLLAREKYHVMPLHEIIGQWLRDDTSSLEGRRIVALTCDDGSDFDFRDLNHPVAGPQRSVLNLLREFQERSLQAAPRVHMTSFVIVSPDARKLLDRTCMIGADWWNDDWWNNAIDSGLMGIANHSWDHHHDSLPDTFDLGVPRGTFKSITNAALADAEIRRASEYLWQRAPNPSAALFAYPYGEANEYLVDEYFPRFGDELNIKAAFSDSPAPLTSASNRWVIPRYICGRDWTTPDGLGRVLADAISR